jgi:hypothetical protein
MGGDAKGSAVNNSMRVYGSTLILWRRSSRCVRISAGSAARHFQIAANRRPARSDFSTHIRSASTSANDGMFIMKPKLTIQQQEAEGELIALASEGKLTPAEAEQRAIELGCGPLAYKPGADECDPLRRPRWTLIMTVAWIASRDLVLVRESSPEYAAVATCWRCDELNLPGQDGTFQRRKINSVVDVPPRIRAWLRDAEISMTAHGELPATTVMPVSEAWDALWRAAGSGDLVATALDSEGRVVEIPQTAWEHLAVFDERNRTVLKRRSLDPRPAYTDVSLDRLDVLKRWRRRPSYGAVDVEELLVEKSAYAPFESGDEEFVPLSCAIYWLGTDRGVREIQFGDQAAWGKAVKLISLKIQCGKIELIGRRQQNNEIIAGIEIAGIPIHSPAHLNPSDIGISSPSHIACSVFLDRDEWIRSGGDQLYRSDSAAPMFTHLQVRSSQVRSECPEPAGDKNELAIVKSWLIEEMRASPEQRLKNKSAYKAEAQGKFSMSIGLRPFATTWSDAAREAPAPAWLKPGPTRGSVQHTNRVQNARLKRR